MAEITVPGPLSGRPYQFLISGSSPSVDERQRIDAYLSQAEQGFMQEYEQTMGRPLDTGEGEGVLNWLGEIPKGILSGAVGLGETALLGAASALPEGAEDFTREAIRAGAYALKPQADIGMEEAVSGKFGQALGSTLPFFVAGPAAPYLAAATGVGEASERARAAGATPEERAMALLPGGAVGLSEVILPNFVRGLGREATLGITQRLQRIAASAGVEGAQETAANIAQNLISKGIYDPEQGVFTGSGESAGYGAGVGGLIQGLMDLAVPGRPRGAGAPQLQLPPPSEAERGQFDDDAGGAAPATGEPTAAERAAAQAVQGLPDPTAPVTTATLDELGVPKNARTYRLFQNGVFAGPQAADQLESFVTAAEASDRTDLKALTPRIRDFISELRTAQPPSVPAREPMMTEAEAFEAAVSPEKTPAPAPVAEEQLPLFEPQPEPEVRRGLPALQQAQVAEALDTEFAASDIGVPTPQDYAAAESKVVENPTLDFADVAVDVASAKIAPAPEVVPDAPAPEVVPDAPAPEVVSDVPTQEEQPSILDVTPTAEPTPSPRESSPSEAAVEPEVSAAPPAQPEPTRAQDEADLQALSEPDVAERQPMTGATPGTELGTAGQAIPAPIAPAVRPTPTRPAPKPSTEVKAPTPPADPVADAAVASQLANTVFQNASPELRSMIEQSAPDAETMPTTTADKAAVLQLLQLKPKKGKSMSALQSQRYYAYAYFSKHTDPGTALHAIAHDLAAKGELGVPKFRSADSIRKSEDVVTPQLAADLAYYEDTGTEPALRAAAWVRKNMSPETFAATQELQSRYQPKDFAAQSAARDARAAARAEARKDAQNYLDSIAEPGERFRDTTADEAAELGLAQEDAEYLDRLTADFRPTDVVGAPLHPRVVEYLRNGDITGALRNFAATTTNKHMRSLAEKLSPVVAEVRTQIVPDSVMAQIEAAMSPGRTPNPDGAALGVYIPPATPEAIARARSDGREAAADLYEQYGGMVLLNESGGLDAVTFMHEVAHAATDRTLLNPSHPLSRQLTALMEKIAPLTEPGFNGRLNVREFLAEGLTNPDFRIALSRINPDGGKFSAWEMFTNRVKNFLRRMLGMESKTPTSARDVVDTVLDSIIAASPADRGAGDVLSSSFRPLGARKVLADFADRTRVPTKADLAEMTGVLRNVRVPTKFKETMMWLSMPLDYIADAATKYFPENARSIADLVGQHRAEKQTMMEQVQETLQSVVSWVKGNPDKIDVFNDMRLTATRFGVDPRKARSEYQGYTFEYDELDPSGTKVRTITSQRYKTEAERNRAKYDHNMNADRFVSDGRSVFSEDTDQLAAYDEVISQYQSLGPEGRQVVNTLFAIPEYLSAQLSDVLKSRLESMIPQNRALQERIYGQIYDKVFGRNAITPYQSLSRSGEYALSYIGIDPKDIDIDENGRVTREPEVGPTYFTHSFESSAARDAAIRLLEAQNPAYKIQQITPYQQSDPRKSQRVSPGFVAQVLDIIDTASGVDKSARDKIVELVIDAAPETSFLNMFRARKGTRGFEGDITPLTQGLTSGDTIKNVTENSMRLTSNIADIKYGAKFAAARKALTDEANAVSRMPPTGDLVTAAQDAEERTMYLNALTSYTESAFRRQGGVAQTLTTGAWALTLGANVSTAAMTLFTVPTFVFGFFAGKFGAKNSMSAIGRASRLLAGTGGERSVSLITPEGTAETARKKTTRFEVSIDNIDLSDPSSKFQYLAALQDTMRLNGVSGRSLTQDLLQGEMSTGRFKVAQKLLAYSGVFQSTAERFSRETAAIAAYHLALRDAAKAANMGDFSMAQLYKKLEDGTLRFTDAQMQEAALYAVNAAEKTNGPMFAASGPQASQSDLGSVLYLFKRHPLAMYNLLYQTTMRSLPNKAELATMTEAERADAMEDIKIARLQLGGMMGMVGLTAGALGMPFVQQLGWLYDLFADDDEEDFETVVRTTMGEHGAFGLVDYLTGLRVSERIGLSGAFYRPGFNADNLPLMWQVIEGVGGPVVGLGLKYTDRVPKLFAQGEVWRGTEAIAPSAIANVLRAARYSQEGIRTMRGDPIIDDITPVSILSQALGFMPAEYARRLDQNAALSRIDNAIKKQRSDLLSKRYQALDKGDTATFRDVEREISEFNRRHPGPAMITQDTKDASLRGHEETSSRMHYGVNLSKQNIDYLMGIAAQYGASSIYQ